MEKSNNDITEWVIREDGPSLASVDPADQYLYHLINSGHNGADAPVKVKTKCHHNQSLTPNLRKNVKQCICINSDLPATNETNFPAVVKLALDED